ncbi:HNH endonuclease signature motif containing protein [Agrococcus sediminis]|uniref:HNH endonuclease signature motif containing protein n=1 Tax=Agrococcus sediminis TaxID=2599924 RepID=UPI0034350AD0
MIEQAEAAVQAARAMLTGALDFARASDAEVVELLARTAELSRLVDAQRVRIAGEIAERSRGSVDESLCRRLGQHSAKEAVASAFGIRAGDAQAMLALAAATRPAVGVSGADIAARYPRVAQALDAAAISLPQARAIVQQLEPAAPRADLDQLAWAEQQLVTAATDPDWPLGPELLVTQARAYVAVLDPDGVLPSAERQRALRSLRLRQQPDGMWQLQMLCPPEAGSGLKALLDAYTSPRVRVAFRDSGATADDTADDGALSAPVDLPPDEPVDEPVDDRTPEQKRHDVLVALVQAHAASGGAPVAGGESPTLVLTGTIDAYAAYLHGVEHADRTLTIEHTGDLVPIETVDRLLCDALVQKVVLDERGHPLALGRADRLFSRAQKAALAKRDKGCITPGCGMPVAWTEAHHVVWWEQGGATDIDNGVLLCSHCHHEVHAGRLRVVTAGDRPGDWRVVAELHAANRYARARRTTTAAGSPRVATAAHAAASAAAVRIAADAAISPKLAAGSELAPAVPPSSPVPTVRAPRRPRASVEARLRGMARARPNGPRPPAFDLRPPAHIVMRT